MNPRRLFVLLLLVPAACVPTDRLHGLPLAPDDQQAIHIDGDLADWPDGVDAIADGRHVYIRLRPGGEMTLQGAPTTQRLWLDTDLDPSTGRQPAGATDPFGADLEIAFSPPTQTDPQRAGNGVLITSHNADGTTKILGHDDVGLMFAPTYAASEFEVRLDARSVVAVYEETADDPTMVYAAPVAERPSRSSSRADELPERSPGTIRVLSYNVEFASPMKDPEPFVRLIRAIDPDVLLLQEWQDRDGTYDADDLRSWFASNLGECGTWDVLTAEGWGVAVASCHPIRRFGPQDLRRPSNAPADTHIPDRSIRFAGAIVSTPVGDIATASVHLKCCGSANSPEDLARMAEADLINNTLANEFSLNPVAVRVVAGDLNLVGSRPPIDMLRHALDVDGSDLAIAPTPVLGDRATYTWYDAGSRFTPGRLDYVMISDASARIERSFALETNRLSRSCLRRNGLRASDCRASDHLPVIVDLRPVTNP